MERKAWLQSAIGNRKSEIPPLPPGFSLIEILVTVALLSFIVLGLVAMFAQTQRAFKAGLSGGAVLDVGRSVADLLAREVVEARPANISTAANFYVEMPQRGEPIYTPPLLQALPPYTSAAAQQERVNYLQPFFFLSHPNLVWPDRTWVATGYYVVPDNPNGVGIGTLYRYCATNYNAAGAVVSPALLLWDFTNNCLATLNTNLPRIADGVVHLRVRPFAPNGCAVVSDGTKYARTVYCTNYLVPNNLLAYAPVKQSINHVNLGCPDRYDKCWFYSNAMPAYVELELGILDPQTYQRYKAIGQANAAAQLAFLSNHVAQVQLFRQRIAIQNVDPAAY